MIQNFNIYELNIKLKLKIIRKIKIKIRKNVNINEITTVFFKMDFVVFVPIQRLITVHDLHINITVTIVY